MLTLKEAIKIAKGHMPEGYTLRDSYGEAQGQYVFAIQNSQGMIMPGNFHWTVDKETGECKFRLLKKDGDKLWSPIRGYKKLELT